MFKPAEGEFPWPAPDQYITNICKSNTPDYPAGILVYEMLSGYPPFFDDNPFGIYEKILAGKIEWPRHIDPVAKDLIKKLLVQDRTKRLGNMKVRWFR